MELIQKLKGTLTLTVIALSGCSDISEPTPPVPPYTPTYPSNPNPSTPNNNCNIPEWQQDQIDDQMLYLYAASGAYEITGPMGDYVYDAIIDVKEGVGGSLSGRLFVLGGGNADLPNAMTLHNTILTFGDMVVLSDAMGVRYANYRLGEIYGLPYTQQQFDAEVGTIIAGLVTNTYGPFNVPPLPAMGHPDIARFGQLYAAQQLRATLAHEAGHLVLEHMAAYLCNQNNLPYLEQLRYTQAMESEADIFMVNVMDNASAVDSVGVLLTVEYMKQLAAVVGPSPLHPHWTQRAVSVQQEMGYLGYDCKDLWSGCAFDEEINNSGLGIAQESLMVITPHDGVVKGEFKGVGSLREF